MYTRQALLKQVTVPRLMDYLDRKRWTEEPFGRDTVLMFVSPSNPNYFILIPSKKELVDYDRVVEIAIEGISDYELRCVEIRGIIDCCERLISTHRNEDALVQSLKLLRSQEHHLMEEIKAIKP